MQQACENSCTLIRTHILRGARRNRSHGYETPGMSMGENQWRSQDFLKEGSEFHGGRKVPNLPCDVTGDTEVIKSVPTTVSQGLSNAA